MTIVYRRDQSQMGASRHEQDHAAQTGVRIICNAAPVKIHGNGAVVEVEFAYTTVDPDGGLHLTDDRFRLKADQLFRAIGQRLEGVPQELALNGGKIGVTGAGRTNIPGVWAATRRRAATT